MKTSDSRILVVDDDPSIHRDFRQILCRRPENPLPVAPWETESTEEPAQSRTEFEVEFARQGEEALERVRQATHEGRPFAVAFVDMRMPPGWNGVETAGHLWEVDPELEVVLCTADSAGNLLEVVGALGRTDRFIFLNKPFGIAEVQQLATAFSERRRLLRESRLRTEELETSAHALRQARAELEDRVRERTAELGETRSRLEHVLRSSPAVIYSVRLTPPEGLAFITENVSGVLGYTAAEFMADPRFWIARVHPDDEAQAAGFRSRLLDGGASPVQYRFRHQDGSYRWIQDDGRVIRDPQGAPAEIIGSLTDITEQKAAADALKESETRFRNLVNSQGEGVVTTDAEYRFTLANPAAEALLGVWPGQLLGKKLADFLVPADQATLAQHLELRKAGKKSSYEVEIVAATGEHRHLLVTGTPQTDPSGCYCGSFVIFRDITRRKQAERALRESQRYQRAILDNIPDPAWLKDPQGRYLVLNQPLVKIFGLGPGGVPGKAPGGATAELASPLEDEGRRALKERISVRAERRLKDAAGGERWFDTIESPVLDEKGTVTGVVGIARDITERKRVEEKLVLQTSALEAAANGIVITNLEGKIEWVNPAFTQLTGYTAAEAVGSKISILKSGRQDAAFYRRMWEAILRGEVWQGEVVNRRKDGSEYCEEMIITPVRDHTGAVRRFVAIKQDISSRKQTEEALARERDLLRTLMENSPDLIYFKDAESRFLRCSRTLAGRFGLENPDDAVGKTDFDFFSREHAQPAFDDERQIILTGEPIVGKVEEEFWKDQAKTTWVLTSKLPLRNAEGKIVGTFGLSKDITALKQAERDRRTMEVQLRHAQKLEAIGQLSAGIAHEINTPTQYVGDNTRFLKNAFDSIGSVLNEFRGLLEATRQNQVTPELLGRVEQSLADSDLEYLLEEIPKAIRESLEGVERVTRIVRAMKEFSHPGGREKAAADLNKAIESTVTVARNEWKYVADLTLDLDPDLPPVPCYLGEFNQCILNLVVNAAHTIGDVVKKDPGSKGAIVVRTRRDGDFADIRVSDTGAGIPDSVRPHIFEPFFTTKDVGKGTGQGLTIVYSNVVQKHGGKVTFETEVGKGTTFIIRLPLTAPLPSKNGNGRSAPNSQSNDDQTIG